MVLALVSWSLASPAGAVRPFVTDDARIIDVGQLEIETWPDLMLSGGQLHPGYHFMGGVSFTEWFELIVGAGMGLEPSGRLTVANPVIQPKFLIWRAEDNGTPGLALATGLTLPWGQGEMFEQATGYYVIAPVTSRLFDDWLLIHVNVGFTGAHVPSDAPGPQGTSLRPYWGIGLEAGVFHPDARAIVEAYAGDPFEALGPEYAFQWGGRWLVSDHVNLDLTFGAQPEVELGQRVDGRWEFWAQLGVRLLFDVFRDTPGDPMGAQGLVRAPGMRRR